VRPVTIARNYAETLFALAEQSGGAEAWGSLIDETAAAVSTPSIEAVLMSPRVPKERKIAIVRQALHGAPPRFVLFLAALINRGRQMLIGQVADEYRTLLDVKLGRVRAGVTLARDVDALTRSVIVDRLAKAIGKDVIAGFAVDPALLGGVVVKVGDRVYDGSVRKKLAILRQRLVAR
jgi:F-type H+-transporting ATPase subunit delta